MSDIDKVFISNHIKLEILKICGLSQIKPYNLQGETQLAILNISDKEVFCREIEKSLQEIASIYQTGRIITEGDVSKEFTINQCIRLVFTS